MASTIRSRIHKTDPYYGFDDCFFPRDMQGWGSQHPAFAAVLSRKRPGLIIEVGSWKGGSAIHMAELSKKFGFECEIVCVDTWLGSPGLYTRKDDPYYDSLKHRNGYPGIYYTFLANVLGSGHTDIITPLPLTSQHAAEVLTAFGVKADVVYIDAAHDYKSVMLDLESYWPLLADDGVLIGDDYLDWPGVTKAANEFAGRVEKPIYATRGKFIIPKNISFEIGVTFS